MPNAYTWQFTQLDVYPTYETVSNAVFRVHWRRTADDGAGKVALLSGAKDLGPIDPENFIPFGSLTHSIVQGWVEAAMGASGLARLQADLDELIVVMGAPPTQALPPPWV